MKKIIKAGSLFSIVFALSFVSCKKEEPTPTPVSTSTGTSTGTGGTGGGTGTSTASSAPQFTGQLDGVNFSYLNGYVSFSSSGSIGTGGSASNLSYGGSVLDGSTFIEIANVKKGNLYLPGGWSPTNAEFGAFFPLGEYGYDAALLAGTVLTYRIGGVIWSTALGSGDQTGSSFNVVDRLEVIELGDFIVKYKAIFNCKLYDGNGGVKTITNGIIVDAFSNI